MTQEFFAPTLRLWLSCFSIAAFLVFVQPVSAFSQSVHGVVDSSVPSVSQNNTDDSTIWSGTDPETGDHVIRIRPSKPFSSQGSGTPAQQNSTFFLPSSPYYPPGSWPPFVYNPNAPSGHVRPNLPPGSQPPPYVYRPGQSIPPARPVPPPVQAVPPIQQVPPLPQPLPPTP